MISYQEVFYEKIQQLKSEHLYRNFLAVERTVGTFPYAINCNSATPIVIWCSNDYLNMGEHPVVINAMQSAIIRSGSGAGGTRNISGNNSEILKLENIIAKLHKKESALSFVCGYLANQATISTLLNLMDNPVVFSDQNNHASIIEGIKSAKNITKVIFPHNDINYLQQALAKEDLTRHKMIICESIYSMDGDIAPLHQICDLASKYNALLYVDEVHAVGLYGHHGAGIVEKYGLSDRVDVIQGTCSKAYGVIGGYISSSNEIVDLVRSYAKGFIFTTATPPSVAAGASASIDYLMNSTKERKQHLSVVNKLKQKLTDYDIPFINHGTHIIPLIIGEERICKKISQDLIEQYDIFIQYINYPTVPKGLSRLRITPTPKHSDEMIDKLVTSLHALVKKYGILEALKDLNNACHNVPDILI